MSVSRATLASGFASASLSQLFARPHSFRSVSFYTRARTYMVGSGTEGGLEVAFFKVSASVFISVLSFYLYTDDREREMNN